MQWLLYEISECKLEGECCRAWGLWHGRWLPLREDAGMAEKIPGQV